MAVLEVGISSVEKVRGQYILFRYSPGVPEALDDKFGEDAFPAGWLALNVQKTGDF